MRIPMKAFATEAIKNRGMIAAMALRDFESRYAGTVGGAIWAVIQPLATVIVFYFVFAVGLRVRSPNNAPFILWFVAGLVPWMMFNDNMTAITNSVTSYGYLVKKTIFPSQVFAPIQVLAGSIPHLLFLCILAVLLIFYGVPFHPFRLLFVYYYLCIVMLLLSFGWLLSSLQVFYRDIGQAIGIILNVWFWATPVVWPQHSVPEKYHWVLFFNPMYYVIEGYRGTLIYDHFRWPDPAQTLYFWSLTIVVLFVGMHVFAKLKPEFADVI